MVAEAPLHADVAPLAFLLGTWEGRGEGEYPTIDPFPYEERIEIGHVGDAYLTVVETSWAPDGAAVHLERGFILPGTDGEVELVLAHPIGVTEVAVGTVEAGVIELRSIAVSLTPTASPVTELRRRIEARGDELSFELHMAMEGVELLSHVRSRLACA